MTDTLFDDGRKPRLLDLFCCAGGAGTGYAQAGFEVVGVDITPQPRYPFEFHQADALTFPLDGFDAIHASPPCPGYSVQGGDHPLLIEPVRERLEATGLPYVIENIPDARKALRAPTTLCGSSFGLRVRRHRLFETNWLLMGPPCAHGLQSSNPHRIRAPYTPAANAIVPVYGGGQVGFPGGGVPRRDGHRLDDARRTQGSDPAGVHRVHRRAAIRVPSSAGGRSVTNRDQGPRIPLRVRR